jgi:hypothetical protein
MLEYTQGSQAVAESARGPRAIRCRRRGFGRRSARRGSCGTDPARTTPGGTEEMRILLGCVLAVGLGIILRLSGSAAFDSSLDPLTRSIFIALFAFMASLGYLSFRIFTSRPTDLVATLNRASIYSDEFLDAAFHYYNRNGTTARITTVLLSLPLIILIVMPGAAILALGAYLPKAYLLLALFSCLILAREARKLSRTENPLRDYFRMGWSSLRRLEESRSLGPDEQRRSLVAIASLWRDDPISHVIVSRLSSETKSGPGLPPGATTCRPGGLRSPKGEMR